MDRQSRAFHCWTGLMSLFCMALLLSCGGDGGGGGGTPTVPPPTASAILYVKASNPGSGDAFGQSIAASADGNSLVVGARGEASNATGINGNQTDNSALNAGAAYVYTRDSAGNVSQAYVKASNTGAGDFFGFAVALSADGNTLAVGAIGEASNATGINGDQADNSTTFAGAVYIFTRNGGIWSQQAYVKASNTGRGDQFGTAVTLSADGNTLAVGAIFGQILGEPAREGAAYVFTRSGGIWSEQAYLNASNAEAGDHFGHTVTLSADGNTLAVGAIFEDSNATGVDGNQADNSASQSGAVYIFTRSGAVWSQQTYVKASNTGAGDLFGYAVALSSNGNTLAVGAYLEASNATGINGNQADNSAGSAGAVYVFTRTGIAWSQQAYVKGSNTEASDGFGISVALSADGNTLAVGAISESSNATGMNGNQADNSAAQAGATYVFTRSIGIWSQRDYVKASNTGAFDHFGISVALSADGSALAVGAHDEDSSGSSQADNSALNAGAVYIY